jgi:hypothetical protein
VRSVTFRIASIDRREKSSGPVPDTIAKC